MNTIKILARMMLCLLLLASAVPVLAQDAFHSSWAEISKADLQSYKTLTAEALKMQLNKGQVKVVIFWAEWCDFCKSELRMISQYQKLLPAGQLNIIAINQDTKFELGIEKAKLYENELTVVHDKNAALKKKLNVMKLPLTLIFSESGDFQTAYSGFSNERFNYIRKRINSLLKKGDGET